MTRPIYDRLATALVCLAIVACEKKPVPVPAPPYPVVFEGTITSIETARRPPPGAPVYVADFDPRFLVTLRVDTIKSGTPPWSPSAAPTFHVHSPTRTFGVSEPGPERFRFTVDRNDGGEYSIVATTR